MRKTSTHRQKIALQARHDFMDIWKSLLVLGFWMFLAMIGNALTDCWR